MKRIDAANKWLEKLLENLEVAIVKLFGYWGELLFGMLKIPFLVIKNPKFVFPFIIIMLISSAGVWAPWAFKIDLSGVCNTNVNEVHVLNNENLKSISVERFKVAFDISCDYVKSMDIILMQSFSLFMFNVGILGGIAAEFVLRTKVENERERTDSEKVKEYAAFLFWLLAFILSFYGLKEPSESSTMVNIATWLSVSLWICTNYHKKEYEIPTDIRSTEGGTNLSEQSFSGPGLSSESDIENADIADTELNGKGLK
ncbi:hypothetical protein L1D31_20210 [Vibrio sp. Isolate23]|uniref:hypothetical protein n=1 Tax=Vibrio sp. Isolate23 TaxID=2908533 RepID=UPI001EFE65AA|nr:hypothetical protein [Vibrio sp. Isolate23]MCG9684856.1 hypothetical protein [Vibrio sp. Isolate23]